MDQAKIALKPSIRSSTLFGRHLKKGEVKHDDGRGVQCVLKIMIFVFAFSPT